MGGFAIDDMGSALRFTSYGATGAAGAACFGGPTYMNPNTSYYANGSVNLYFGSTRGLVNALNFGASNFAATAFCNAVDYTHTVTLTTAGVTADLTYEFIKPTAHFRHMGWESTIPDYNRIEIGVRNGVIIKLKDWQGRRVVNSFGINVAETLTAGLNLQAPELLSVTDQVSSINVTGGITATVSYQVVDEISFSGYYAYFNYRTITIVITSGLIQSVSVTSGTASVAYTYF
jgi:hypothetical protein